MEKINYDRLYNVMVEWNDGASDVLPIGGKYPGRDGNPFGFTHIEDAIEYRDAFLETSRKDLGSEAVRVSIIVGERVYR
jgi:hypothetical protein